MSAEFLILGAGVSGLAVAQRLLMQGAKVTIVERGAVGQESSWAGGGILSPLCPWDYSDAVNNLCKSIATDYSAWITMLHAETSIDPEYERSGMLVLPSFDVEAAQAWCASHSVTMQLVDQAYTSGKGLLLPGAAQVRNPRLIQALRKHVEILGGRIVEQCEVRGIEVREGRVQAVTTSGGKFSADRYIVSAGAWSKQVLGQYALKLDIKPMRGQMLLFKFAAPPLKHIVLQDGMYLIPRRDGHLLVGSTLEDVGFDKRTTTGARDSLRQRAELLLPQLREMPLVQHWSGLRPASPGNIPSIGRHPQLENLYLNSGHFRYGVTMAPASAAILLNELYGGEQPFDVSVYRAGWDA